MAVEIKLSNSDLVALIDEEDASRITSPKRSWRAQSSGKYKYAAWSTTRDGSSVRILMHQVILGTEPGVCIKHLNGNGLDNRKENLMIETKGAP